MLAIRLVIEHVIPFLSSYSGSLHQVKVVLVFDLVIAIRTSYAALREG